jgi:hypothetical protein
MGDECVDDAVDDDPDDERIPPAALLCVEFDIGASTIDGMLCDDDDDARSNERRGFDDAIRLDAIVIILFWFTLCTSRAVRRRMLCRSVVREGGSALTTR